jgi:glycine/D-amino acid oxidase-like deaminating enzyme
MDLRSERPLWPVLDGLIRSYPPLERDLDAEVLVLGSGLSGAYAADALATAGHDVAVVDLRDVAAGSTSASTALLMAEVDAPLVELRRRIGAARADAAYRFLRGALDRMLAGLRRLDCDLVERDVLYLASTRRAARSFEAERRARVDAGLEVEPLDARALRRRFGLRAPGALLAPRGGAVDPYRLAHALLARAVASGARVHDRTRVTRLERRGAGFLARTDRGARIRAARVVDARGYEASDRALAPGAVARISTFALASEPLDEPPPALSSCLVWESARPYLYLRDTPDRRVLVGGADLPFRSPPARDALVGRRARRLARRFERLFPEHPIEIALAWAGTFGATDDGLPRLGFGAGGRRFHALGYGGNGALCSFVAAEALVAALAGASAPALELFPLRPSGSAAAAAA